MSEFYKKLKSIRLEKEIDLEKIHKRTKISLSALNAIEKGKFDQLSYTYVRLFLKAYSLEIGVDPDETLEEYEIFIGNKTVSKDTKIENNPIKSSKILFSSIKDENQQKIDEKKAPLVKKPSLSIRTDITKSIFIILTLIFAIYIILSINEEVEAKKPKEFVSDFEEEGPISDLTLENNYVKISETKQALKATSPFSITLTTDRRLWYEIKSDDLVKSEQVLPIGDNHLHRFKNKINIKFNQTLGLNLYLNENNLSILKSGIYPVRLIISIPDKTVSILQYSPKK
tara:strand:- start:831 stop:1685 length:855 start_codon:yes stop_codon:yes gene_type:complete